MEASRQRSEMVEERAMEVMEPAVILGAKQETAGVRYEYVHKPVYEAVKRVFISCCRVSL